MQNNDTVTQIKERLDIVDIISSYLTVHKSGKHLKANCPFHRENTPSFFISPERQSYYCFGCSAKGDMFSFIENYEGVDFKEALRILADRAGVTIVHTDPKERSEKQQYMSVLERAQNYFVSKRNTASEVEEYITKRGLAGEPSTIFGIGYAPDGWRNLYEHLTALKISESELLAVGLIKKTDDGKMYDVFRNRIMFPIHDSAGRVVGFSGRALPGADDKTPKYLNSPETKLFQKSSLLYAYDKAKAAMRRLDFALLVEGQIDVIACHKAGYRNTVAPLGTALTTQHIGLIMRMTDNILFALDADDAGIASMQRGAHLALAAGADVKVARLPHGTDPADIIERDSDEWKAIVKEATHVIPFLVQLLRERNADDRVFQKQVRKDVLPYLARIDDGIDQAYFIKHVAGVLGVSEDVIISEVAKVKLDSIELPQESYTEPQNDSPQLSHVNRIASQIQSAILLAQDERLSSEWVQRLQELVGEDLPQPDDAYMFEMEGTFENSSALSSSVTEMFFVLERAIIEEKVAQCMQELRHAESTYDENVATQVVTRIQELNTQLENVTKRMEEYRSQN